LNPACNSTRLKIFFRFETVSVYFPGIIHGRQV
jgi:hypothetical protein